MFRIDYCRTRKPVSTAREPRIRGASSNWLGMTFASALLISGLMVTMISQQAEAAPNHLAEPPIAFFQNGNPILSYDNAELPFEYGQTFIAEEPAMAGVQVYIGDPSRPGDPHVNELIGPADLVLYDTSDLPNLVELGRSEVAASGVVLSGLTALFFDAPIPTAVGTRYAFVISTTDPGYGIGMRSLFESTYAGGNGGRRDPNTGLAADFPEDGNVGRDLSFEILGPAVLDLSLAPVNSTRLTLTQHCVVATATNSVGTVVPGVPVGFVVTGANPGSGSATTGAAGTAQHCYTGNNGGVDAIQASVVGSLGSMVATASVTFEKRNTTLKVAPVPAVTVTQGLQLKVLLSPKAILRDVNGNVPVQGKLITFKAGATTLCAATTDATGTATCQVTLLKFLAGLLRLGYSGTYAGDAAYNPSSGGGGILGLTLF